MQALSIIGCGWLGKPLALRLKASYKLHCYARQAPSDDLLDYCLAPSTEHPFYKSPILIIAISTRDEYLSALLQITQAFSPDTTVYLISSTSVYREFDQEVDETAIITQKSVQKEAEELLAKHFKKLVILRLGGLMGKDRIAGKWKRVSTFEDGPVNYIHQDDAIKIIVQLIDRGIVRGVFNLVSPRHPLRSAVHQKNAREFGFELGQFEGIQHRIINSDKIISTLEYTFKHPDPLNFWTSL